MKRYATVLLALLTALAISLPAFAGEKTLTWHSEDGSTIVLDGEHEIIIGGDEAAGGYLGITLSELDEETAKEAGLRKAEGALVLSVFDDTPADEAGMEAGDVIVEFGGEKITSTSELVELVRSREPGDKVKVRVRRDGKRKSFRVTLGEREQSFTIKGLPSGLHDQRFMAKGMSGCAPFGDGHGKQFKQFLMCGPEGLSWTHKLQGMPGRARLGVDVRDLEGDLAGYFEGAEAGALVLGVHDDSAAEKAGLTEGDVIVQLGEAKVAGVGDLRDAVAGAAGEGERELVFFRKGKRESVQVEIEKGELHIAVERFKDVFEHGDAEVHKIIRRLEGEDWEAKLQHLEEKLKELEERLEEKFEKDKG